MKIVDVVQGSEAWHRWRSGGFSASDASIILGRNPYKTAWRLWAEKTGYAQIPDLENNPCIRRGRDYEDKARQAAEDYFSDMLLPLCGQSSRNPLIRASFDGVRFNGEPTELKCPFPKNWQDVVSNGVNSAMYKLYYPQVQVQIYVADVQQGWLVVYSVEEDDFRVYPVPRDNQMISEIILAAGEFWDQVIKKEPPPKDIERDVFIPQGDDADAWIYEAENYRLHDHKMQELKQQMEVLRSHRDTHLDAMKSLMVKEGYCHAEFAGIRLCQYNVEGKIDYEKMLAEKAPSLKSTEAESYRKPSSSRYRVTVTNQAMPRGIIDDGVADTLLDVDDGPVQTMYF